MGLSVWKLWVPLHGWICSTSGYAIKFALPSKENVKYVAIAFNYLYYLWWYSAQTCLGYTLPLTTISHQQVINIDSNKAFVGHSIWNPLLSHPADSGILGAGSSNWCNFPSITNQLCAVSNTMDGFKEGAFITTFISLLWWNLILKQSVCLPLMCHLFSDFRNTTYVAYSLSRQSFKFACNQLNGRPQYFGEGSWLCWVVRGSDVLQKRQQLKSW